MKLFYLIIFLILSFNTYSQTKGSFYFKENFVEKVDYKIDSLLIIGVGSTATRIYLDQFNESFINNLNKKGVVTQYYYLGKNIDEAQAALDTMSKIGYKALLFFLPKNESFYGVSNKITSLPNDYFTINTLTTKVNYQQDFNLVFCRPDGLKNSFWTATLKVACDLSDKKNNKKLALEMLRCFELHDYVK